MAKDSTVTDRVARREEEKLFRRVIVITQLTGDRFSRVYFEIIRNLDHILTRLWYI